MNWRRTSGQTDFAGSTENVSQYISKCTQMPVTCREVNLRIRFKWFGRPDRSLYSGLGLTSEIGSRFRDMPDGTSDHNIHSFSSIRSVNKWIRNSERTIVTVPLIID